MQREVHGTTRAYSKNEKYTSEDLDQLFKLELRQNDVSRVIDNDVRDCYTGIAVKDLSEVEIRDARLSRLQVGVAAYIKKPTFGPSRARLFGVQMADVATEIMRDDACTIEREPPSLDPIVISGYPDLRSFSRDYEDLFKAELGGTWRSYLHT